MINTAINKIRISAVSYLNTYPYMYGIEKFNINKTCDISTDIPAICAQKLLENKADIGLIPTAVIPQLHNANIFNNYGLYSKNIVKTVLLISNTPLNKIKNVLLDAHSRTSVQLIKILAAEYWKIKPEWHYNIFNIEEKINKNTAALVIGDKAFDLSKKYEYTFDLAYEWYKYTNLPFVFACWVSNKQIPQEIIAQLTQSFDFGTQNIESCINYYKVKIPISNHTALSYLSDNIYYKLNEKTMQSIQLFLEKIKK